MERRYPYSRMPHDNDDERDDYDESPSRRKLPLLRQAPTDHSHSSTSPVGSDVVRPSTATDVSELAYEHYQHHYDPRLHQQPVHSHQMKSYAPQHYRHNQQQYTSYPLRSLSLSPPPSYPIDYPTHELSHPLSPHVQAQHKPRQPHQVTLPTLLSVYQSPSLSTPRLPSIRTLTSATAAEVTSMQPRLSSRHASSEFAAHATVPQPVRNRSAAAAMPRLGSVAIATATADELANLCRYRNKRCGYERAIKRNGDRHNLCEKHRVKANQNQRKLESKRRIQKTVPSGRRSVDRKHDELQPTPSDRLVSCFGGASALSSFVPLFAHISSLQQDAPAAATPKSSSSMSW